MYDTVVNNLDVSRVIFKIFIIKDYCKQALDISWQIKIQRLKAPSVYITIYQK